MDFFSTYYVFFQLVVSGIVFSFLWNWRRKANEDSNGLKSYGITDILQLIYMGYANTGIVAGYKKSRFQNIYNKYLSSSSAFTKKPHLFKIFGYPLALLAHDHETIYKMHRSSAFSDRAPDVICRWVLMGEPAGLIINNGKNWKENKRYTKKKLAELGWGKQDSMTALLADYLPMFLERIESVKLKSGNKIQMKSLFSTAILNVGLSFLVGLKFSEEDPEFRELYDLVQESAHFPLFNVLMLFLVQKIWGLRQLFGYSRHKYIISYFKRFTRGFIDEREALGFYKENPEVFVDYFLQEIEKQKGRDEFKNVYCKDQLSILVGELAIAAMESTSNFLETLVMFMCLYPDVQAKVQHEIDSVIGTSALPLYYDYSSRMPYVMATFYEVHRLLNVVGIVPKMTSEDTQVGEHFLKKGTIVVSLLFALRYDDTYWKEPTAFNPERFLNESGNLAKEKVDRMLLFGTGLRMCPGDKIAPVMSFTFGVGFLQRFTVKKADDSEILGLRENLGVSNGPDPFHISIFER